MNELTLRSDSMIEYIADNEDEERYYDFESAIGFLKSLSWRVQRAEMMWGEYIRVT